MSGDGVVDEGGETEEGRTKGQQPQPAATAGGPRRSGAPPPEKPPAHPGQEREFARRAQATAKARRAPHGLPRAGPDRQHGQGVGQPGQGRACEAPARVGQGPQGVAQAGQGHVGQQQQLQFPQQFQTLRRGRRGQGPPGSGRHQGQQQAGAKHQQRLGQQGPAAQVRRRHRAPPGPRPESGREEKMDPSRLVRKDGASRAAGRRPARRPAEERGHQRLLAQGDARPNPAQPSTKSVARPGARSTPRATGRKARRVPCATCRAYGKRAGVQRGRPAQEKAPRRRRSRGQEAPEGQGDAAQPGVASPWGTQARAEPAHKSARKSARARRRRHGDPAQASKSPTRALLPAQKAEKSRPTASPGRPVPGGPGHGPRAPAPVRCPPCAGPGDEVQAARQPPVPVGVARKSPAGA